MKNIYLLILLFSVTINAQLVTVTGVVSDELGPLQDITIKIKGTNKGTVTDFDGNYTINADIGDILVFTHISYTTQQKVIKSNIINITLTTGYYIKTIYTKQKKHKKHVLTLNYYSGIKHTKKGFLINLYIPKIIRKPNPELVFAYQFDENNKKIDTEIRLAYLYKLFRKSIDLNLVYNKTKITNFDFESYIIENLFSHRILQQNFDFYIGFGRSTLNKSTDKIGYEIGINKRFFKHITLYNKTIFWSKNFQFKNGIIVDYKKFNLLLEHNKYRIYNDFNIGFGYIFRF